MQTLAMCIEYDGSRYCGWQRQKNAETVQQKVEEALASITGYESAIVGAGRTDAGVHARGQVAHAALHKHCTIPESNLVRAVNSKLPADIMILKAKLIECKFHARFDAIAREYSYTISVGKSVFNRLYSYSPEFPFDELMLMEAASIFTGTHDFSTFSKKNPDTKNYICKVKICSWTKGKDFLRLRIKADRFVYGMVRSVTGAMLDIARGKRTCDNVKGALAKADRRLISPLAPPQGLTLERIYYPKNLKIFS